MSTEKQQDNFFHPQPFSLRAICPEWVKARCDVIAQNTDFCSEELVLQEALEEVMNQLVTRTGPNHDDTRAPLVYLPDGPGEPYVMMIPIRGVPQSKRPKADIPSPKFAPNPNNKRSSLRLEFEDTVFEIEPGLNKSDLAKDVNGNYVNARVRGLWDGFKMYHNKFTQAKSPDFRDNYNKTLGRYVIAKIGTNGVALFNRAPYRHMTMGQATEEATRLADEHKEGFAIFRCMDIVGRPQEELT